MLGPLKNQRYEAFAVAVAGLEDAGTAYKRLWKVKGKSAWESASRLKKNPLVASRVAELSSRAVKKLEEKTQERIEEMAGKEAGKVARIIGDALTQAEMLAWLSNAVMTPIGNLDGASMLTHSIETTSLPGPDADAGSLPLHKLKAHDKVRCIELAAKLQGMLVEKQEVKVGASAEMLSFWAMLRGGSVPQEHAAGRS